MENYSGDVFLSEPFVLSGRDSIVNFYIPPHFLRGRKSFDRVDGSIAAYKDNHGKYRLPEACGERGMTIIGERSMDTPGQRCTIYSFAPGMNPKKEEFKLLITLRKQR